MDHTKGKKTSVDITLFTKTASIPERQQLWYQLDLQDRRLYVYPFDYSKCGEIRKWEYMKTLKDCYIYTPENTRIYLNTDLNLYQLWKDIEEVTHNFTRSLLAPDKIYGAKGYTQDSISIDMHYKTYIVLTREHFLLHDINYNKATTNPTSIYNKYKAFLGLYIRKRLDTNVASIIKPNVTKKLRNKALTYTKTTNMVDLLLKYKNNINLLVTLATLNIIPRSIDPGLYYKRSKETVLTIHALLQYLYQYRPFYINQQYSLQDIEDSTEDLGYYTIENLTVTPDYIITDK